MGKENKNTNETCSRPRYNMSIVVAKAEFDSKMRNIKRWKRERKNGEKSINDF